MTGSAFCCQGNIKVQQTMQLLCKTILKLTIGTVIMKTCILSNLCRLKLIQYCTSIDNNCLLRGFIFLVVFTVKPGFTRTSFWSLQHTVPGYTLIHHDRMHSNGGGVAMCVNNMFTFTVNDQISDINYNSFESMFINLAASSRLNL